MRRKGRRERRLKWVEPTLRPLTNDSPFWTRQGIKTTYVFVVFNVCVINAVDEQQVPAMISGASHADVGVLVISARKGEFESGFEKNGQTREHAMLAFTLGIRKLILVVNKMDDPTVQWDRERYDEIVGKLTPYLKSCGFKVKKDVFFMPIAALSGAGVKRRVDLVKECPWAKEFNEGKSLIELCEGLTLEERNSEAGLRVSVLASYVDRGVWAIGKIESGTLVRGSQVCISPTSVRGTVVEILIDEVSVRSAKTGENVCVKIKSPDVNTETDIQKGYVLSDVRIGSKQFTATIRLLELLETHPGKK
jgi:peptide chain release factor subunit 3